MKKLTKRIMALMLSLVMIFGCIPSYINEASASGNTKTLAELIGTFPSTDATGWTSENGSVAYYDNNELVLKKDDINLTYASTIEFTKNLKEDSYSYKTTDNGFSVSLSIELNKGKIASIIYNNNYNAHSILGGIYLPAKMTVAEIIKTRDFPTTADEAWTASNENYVYSNGNNLSFFVGQSMFDLGDATELTKEATTNNYKTSDGKITFVIRISKVTCIKCEGTEYDGTYWPTTISLNFDQPATYTDLVNLYDDFGDAKTKFISWGESLKDFKKDVFTTITDNSNDSGYYYLESIYTFNTPQACYKDACLNIKNIFYRNVKLDIEDVYSYIDSETIKNDDKILNMKANDVLCFRAIYDAPNPNDSNYEIHIFEKVDLRKSLTITLPAEEGTTVSKMSTDIDCVELGKTSVTDLQVFEIVDGKISAQTKLNNEDNLEKDKDYYVYIKLSDPDGPACTLVKVNDTSLYTSNSSNISNHFNPGSTVVVIYILSLKQPVSSGSSKKYKADDKDTAEKVSGSGKKGSTRTITPIEGKKVSSVIVKDKDGNKVDVTLNEDGTYSFVQPASDVNIEVTYKNREITLNIGSTEASVDGEKSNLDVCPVTRNDRTMLPIRFVAENLGAKVEWNEKKPDYVAITRGDTKIEITLGSDIMLVNGKEVKLDSVAFAENDRTYLPVRAISEALNAIVEWNEERPMEVKIYER